MRYRKQSPQLRKEPDTLRAASRHMGKAATALLHSRWRTAELSANQRFFSIRRKARGQPRNSLEGAPRPRGRAERWRLQLRRCRAPILEKFPFAASGDRKTRA